MITNNDIKYQDATDLKRYLDLLSRKGRSLFKHEVIFVLNIHPQTFANWKAMSCRIPSRAKAVMEDIAQTRIFSIFP